MTGRSHHGPRAPFGRLGSWASATLAVFVVVAAALLATAQDAPWQVTEVAGEARLLPAAAQPRPLAVGDTVGPGDSVETGADGRARLTRAADAMTLSPNSQMTIPAAAAGPDAPSVLQRLGTLLFEIDSRFGTDRFRVETPYLAAVIKGTVFTVTVGPQGGALSVIEGLVEVRRPGAAQPVLVQPGATVRAPAGQGGRLDLIEPNGGGDNPAPAEPGGDDQGSREDDRGQGPENAETEGHEAKGQGRAAEARADAADAAGNGKAKGKDKAWKIGFDPGVGDVGEATDGFLKNKRDGALDGSFASTDSTAVGPSSDGATGNSNGGEGPPGQAAIPPGQGGTLPGQGGIPPGQGGTPPGQGGTPPGQGGTPPGQSGIPPGQGGNPNAGGGNPNAGVGNPHAGGGNPNAGGGNPNAGVGNPNAGGGNPNGGGGNPNSGGVGNPNAGGGNPNSGGIGNPNAGGGNPNAGVGNPNAGGSNPNAGGGNPNAGGVGNPNAGGGNPNSGGVGNPNAGGSNPNAGGVGNPNARGGNGNGKKS